MKITFKELMENVLAEDIPKGTLGVKGFDGKKLYYTMDNIGSAKYTVSFHNGVDVHKDGSPFYGIDTFKNKKKYEAFIKELIAKGYKEKY